MNDRDSERHAGVAVVNSVDVLLMKGRKTFLLLASRDEEFERCVNKDQKVSRLCDLKLGHPRLEKESRTTQANLVRLSVSATHQHLYQALRSSQLSNRPWLAQRP